MTIQAILFDNKKWNTAEARQYLKQHNIRAIKPVHKTSNLLRYRIEDPNHFSTFSTKKLDNGITLVIGYV